MISIDIPGFATIELHHAIFDINGTLAVDGVLIPGVNDVGMLHAAAIGIAVMIAEGVATSALQVADVLASGPLEAIDLVLKPKRLIATLRR